MISGATAMRVDPSGTFQPTQHALAGKAALALAQLSEKSSHELKLPENLMEYVQKVNSVAQKAELTRKILERYLVGTEVNRVDPVLVPYYAKVVSSYRVPINDRGVATENHLPYDLNMPLSNIGNTVSTASFKNPVTKASMSIEQGISVLVITDRRDRIKSFI